MKATSVALPKTYHQFVERGVGCWMIGSRLRDRPSRSLVKPQARRSQSIRRSLSADLQRTRQHLHVVLVQAHLVAEERLGRRAAGHRAAGVVDAAVAGAQEEL